MKIAPSPILRNRPYRTPVAIKSVQRASKSFRVERSQVERCLRPTLQLLRKTQDQLKRLVHRPQDLKNVDSELVALTRFLFPGINDQAALKHVTYIRDLITRGLNKTIAVSIHNLERAQGEFKADAGGSNQHLTFVRLISLHSAYALLAATQKIVNLSDLARNWENVDFSSIPPLPYAEKLRSFSPKLSSHYEFEEPHFQQRFETCAHRLLDARGKGGPLDSEPLINFAEGLNKAMVAYHQSRLQDPPSICIPLNMLQTHIITAEAVLFMEYVESH